MPLKGLNDEPCTAIHCQRWEKVLNLETAEEGGYVVTSPLDPELVTEAETLEDAFVNARDAAKALRESRAKLLRKLSATDASR